MKVRSVVLAILSLSMVSMPIAAHASNRWMRIDNQTDDTVLEMHVSNVGTNDWGPDQLGDTGIISPHHHMDWNIDDGSGYCRFDFKFVMKNEPDKFAYNINVCTDYQLNVVDN